MRQAVVFIAVTAVIPGSAALACQACVGGGRLGHAPLPAPLANVTSFQMPAERGGALVVPALSSRPGARAKLFLDFDGDFTPAWGSFSPGVTPAYSIDADTTTFTPTELSNIERIWSGVAEKFSPFDLDVTTVPPADQGHLDMYRVVVGGSGSWFGLAGGVAYLNGFSNSAEPNTGFVFSGNLLPSDPLHASFVTAASAHEAGHGFGLYHQSVWNGNQLVDEYNRGNAVKAPIMGSSYRKRGIWWQGPSWQPSIIQRDVDIISDSERNEFGYREDDHGNDIHSATPLVPGGPVLNGFGVIETRLDIDFFSFTWPGGLGLFAVEVAPFDAMLDAAVLLYNLAGDLLYSQDTASQAESFLFELPAGQFALAVDSHGAVGDIGQYWVRVSTEVPEPATGSLALAVAAACLRRKPPKSRPKL